MFCCGWIWCCYGCIVVGWKRFLNSFLRCMRLKVCLIWKFIFFCWSSGENLVFISWNWLLDGVISCGCIWFCWVFLFLMICFICMLCLWVWLMIWISFLNCWFVCFFLLICLMVVSGILLVSVVCS